MSTASNQDSSTGHYQLITKLGQGGMARVLLMLARGRSGVDKLLVVKELLSDLKEEPEFLAMFLDEARLAARLNHPNVVQTYEVNDDGMTPLIVMEYLEGQSLTALLNRVGRDAMPLPLHLHILAQVLTGLHHAHELCDFDGTHLGVVHRDISPQNIFVTYEGQVKLVDFGIAKARTSGGRTRTGVFKGKIAYASPEQTACGGVDRRSDIFAVGVLLWEAIARQRIAGIEADIVVMQRRVHGEDPGILTVAPETPEELARICDRAMAPKPEDRFATAEELRAALGAYLESSKRIGAHELSELIQKAFAEDRAKIRRAIDACVKALRSADATASSPDLLAIVPPSPREGTPPGGKPAVVEETRSTVRGSSLTAPLPTPGGRARAFVPLGLVVLGAAMIGLFQRPLRSTFLTGPELDAGLSASSSLVLPDASPGAEAVDVTIVVNPPEARVFLDGVAAATNPFHTSLPRSAQTHVVRAVAPGFTTEERLVVFEHNLELQWKLSPAPPASAEASPWRPPRPGTPAGHARPLAPDPPPTARAAVTSVPGEALSQTSRRQPRTIDSTF